MRKRVAKYWLEGELRVDADDYLELEKENAELKVLCAWRERMMNRAEAIAKMPSGRPKSLAEERWLDKLWEEVDL